MTTQQNPHVLVTGAGGYVGRHVVTALLDHGASVTAVVRRKRAYVLDERAEVVERDILDPELDVASLSDGPPDVVVHLAWEAGFAHASPVHMLRLSDHYRLLDALATWGVTRLAVLGTMHEVGYHEGAIDEDTPTHPTSLYGIAKDALRRATFAGIADRAEVSWLRAFYIYGDDRANQSVFTKLLQTAETGQRTFPFTSGRNQFDFIHVDELATQIAVASLHPEGTGVINVCSGEPRALGDQVERFIADQGLDVTLEYGAFPDRPYDSPVVYGDASRIRALLASA